MVNVGIPSFIRLKIHRMPPKTVSCEKAHEIIGGEIDE